ncbi:MAG: pyridoxal phosphate-dependent aminotransferase [Bacteroidales bacterium]
MEHVSNRIANLAASATVAMNQKSTDLKARGINIINLSVGEPDFNTPDQIKEAAKKAIDENYSFYTPVAGYPELLKAISEKFKRENHLDYSPSDILVSNGAKHSIANAILALVNPGDEVIIPSPYWVSYAELVKLAEGRNVIVEAGIDQDFKVTAEQIKAAITRKTKVLLLCSPTNPTGSVYSAGELKEIAEVVAEKNDMYIISDEIYEHINFIGKHESIAQFDFIKDRVVNVNGVSKAYAMTGWRIGYMAAASWIVKACNKLQGQMTTGASSIAQRAAIAALNSDPSVIQNMKNIFQRRRDLVLKLMGDIEGVKFNVPQGAFYVFPDISSFFGKKYGNDIIKDSTDFAMYLLNEANIATVPGIAFGAPDCIRISYATSDENLVKALEQFKMATGKLS